ncbi:hypothetical protein D3C83_35720 [compost metagenome]
MQRPDLGREIVRHRRPVGLVLGIGVVAKRLALGIEYAGAVVGDHVLVQPAQHVEHAIDRAGRFAARVAQLRQRVERPIEVRRTVNQEERLHCKPVKGET